MILFQRPPTREERTLKKAPILPSLPPWASPSPGLPPGPQILWSISKYTWSITLKYFQIYLKYYFEVFPSILEVLLRSISKYTWSKILQVYLKILQSNTSKYFKPSEILQVIHVVTSSNTSSILLVTSSNTSSINSPYFK